MDKKIEKKDLLRKKTTDILRKGITEEALHNLLWFYYQDVISRHNDVCSGDYDREVYLPLEDRSSGIYDCLEMLFQNGAKTNAEYDDEESLMTTVSWGDSNMVSFLLDKGADPRKWPDMSDVQDIDRENWYLEEIDVCYMNECWANDCDEELLRGWAETARVLIKQGGLKNFYGFALKVNDEGSGKIGPVKLKY